MLTLTLFLLLSLPEHDHQKCTELATSAKEGHDQHENISLTFNPFYKGNSCYQASVFVPSSDARETWFQVVADGHVFPIETDVGLGLVRNSAQLGFCLALGISYDWELIVTTVDRNGDIMFQDRFGLVPPSGPFVPAAWVNRGGNDVFVEVSNWQDAEHELALEVTDHGSGNITTVPVRRGTAAVTLAPGYYRLVVLYNGVPTVLERDITIEGEPDTGPAPERDYTRAYERITNVGDFFTDLAVWCASYERRYEIRVTEKDGGLSVKRFVVPSRQGYGGYIYLTDFRKWFASEAGAMTIREIAFADGRTFTPTPFRARVFLGSTTGANRDSSYGRLVSGEPDPGPPGEAEWAWIPGAGLPVVTLSNNGTGREVFAVFADGQAVATVALDPEEATYFVLPEVGLDLSQPWAIRAVGGTAGLMVFSGIEFGFVEPVQGGVQ